MRHQNFKGVTLGDRKAKAGFFAAFAAFALLALPLTGSNAKAQTLAALPSMSQPIGDLGAARPI